MAPRLLPGQTARKLAFSPIQLTTGMFCIILRSRMQRKPTTSSTTDSSTVTWSGRLPKAVLAELRLHAKVQTRSIAGQMSVALREWLAANQIPGSAKTEVSAQPPVQGRTAPADAGKRPTPPKDKIQQLLDDPKGWEGTNPTVLGGTKVTI